MTPKIDQFGRVLIPRAIRNRLGLQPGSEVRFHEQPSGLLVTPAEDSVAAELGEAGLFVFHGRLEVAERQAEWLRYRPKRLANGRPAKVLLDSTVLLAAHLAIHPNHRDVTDLLNSDALRQAQVAISQNSLAELFEVLTSTAFVPRIPPALARKAISRAAERFVVLALDPQDYLASLDKAVEAHLSGRAFQDLLQLRAAQEWGVNRLCTLDPARYRHCAVASLEIGL